MTMEMATTLAGFGERIKGLRKSKCLTMEQVATRMIPKKAKSTIANWEAETRKPDILDIQQLAAIYGTSTDFLLGLTKIPYPANPVLDIKEHLKRPESLWDGKPIKDDHKDLIERLMKSVAL